MQRPSPIDDVVASKLCARVVDPGDPRRIHGYDVDADLAAHYGFTDLVLLSLTGELPTAEARAATDCAMIAVSAASVADASVHAAVLARLCGARASALTTVAAAGLAEQSTFELRSGRELLSWLDEPRSPLREHFCARSDEERRRASALTASLPGCCKSMPILEHHPNHDAIVVALFHSAGIRRLDKLEALFTLARLPCALAEAFAEKQTNFGRYPINLPRFRYAEE